MTGSPATRVRVEVEGADSAYYRARTHLVPRSEALALCGLPVQDRYPQRPAWLRVCPECALVFVTTVFPALGASDDR